MYKYLDRPPVIGDVVQYINSNIRTTVKTLNALYIVKSVDTPNKCVYFICDDNLEHRSMFASIKVIATAPASQAKPNDTVISLTDLSYWRSVGSTHKVNRITDGGGFMYVVGSDGINASSENLNEFLLLLKADEPTLNIDNPTTIEEWDARFEAGLPVYYTVQYDINSKEHYQCKDLPSLYAGIYPIDGANIDFFTSDPSCNDTVEANQQPIQTQKEQPMTPTLQQLLTQLFGAAKPQTDYDMKPNFMVVAYSADGTEVATATADSLESVQQHLQANKSLWDCKLVCYKMTAEMQTNVPVAVTHFDDKPAKIKPAKIKPAKVAE